MIIEDFLASVNCLAVFVVGLVPLCPKGIFIAQYQHFYDRDFDTLCVQSVSQK